MAIRRIKMPGRLPLPTGGLLLPTGILQRNEHQLVDDGGIRRRSRAIEETLASFGCPGQVLEVQIGPTATRYGVSLDSGIRMSRVTGLTDDLALALSVARVRVCPIQDKSLLGIEVPSTATSVVRIREVLESRDFMRATREMVLPLAMGLDIAGHTVVEDLAEMPHILMGGATNSGKSVCIKAMIVSLLYARTPIEVRLVLIDPKIIELIRFNGVAHLLGRVESDTRGALSALTWLREQMNGRYLLFATTRSINIEEHNRVSRAPLPRIVVFIDEMADIMLMDKSGVERSVCALAQKARATGIHLVMATQRPSVDVITGLIKANFPARIAFSVASYPDSKVVLDTGGAEKLVGRGDMLCQLPGGPLHRIQGCLITENEIEHVAKLLSRDGARNTPWKTGKG